MSGNTEWIGFDEDEVVKVRQDQQEDDDDTQQAPAYVRQPTAPVAPPREIKVVFMNNYRHCGMEWMGVGEENEEAMCPCCSGGTTPFMTTSLEDIQS